MEKMQSFLAESEVLVLKELLHWIPPLVLPLITGHVPVLMTSF